MGPSARRGNMLAPVRTRLAILLAAVATPLALPGSAAAITPETQITSPTTGSYLLVEEGSKLSIKGTAGPGIASVDILCYFGEGEFEFDEVAKSVPVTSEAFSVEVTTPGLFGNVCQLRAVKHLTLPMNLGPGAESVEAQKHSGPLLAPSDFLAEPVPDNYFAAATTFAGSLRFHSAGGFGFESQLYSTIGHEDTPIFWGELSLEGLLGIATRAAVQVDGLNAYLPSAAATVATKLKVPTSGIPTPSVTKTFNEATRQLTIHEEDPLVTCAPSNAYPPTKESCSSFASAGVTLLRTWQTIESKLALVTETWRSTSGVAHTVNARYVNELHSGAGASEEAGVYRFPGEGGFAPTHNKEMKTLPSGPGLILYKTGPAVSEAGDGVHPQGAWAYDRAPSEPIRVLNGSAELSENDFEMPYQWTVPASGSSTTLRMAFVQSFNLGEARALAEGVLASYHPTVSITAPANGSSIVSVNPTVTAMGTAGDGVGLSALTVNGKAVAVGAGGAWSTPLTLVPGANAITAVATNQSGLSSTAAVTVNYAMPPPATAKVSGKASGKNAKITLTLLCSGVSGQTCKLALGASTLEHLIHKRIVAVSARTHNKRVSVAAATVTLAAGQRLTISLGLNKTGKKLLAHFRSLPVTVKVRLLPGVGKSSTLLSTRLTVKPVPKKKHKHH
jgi:hypothetical protein